ncbi:response regulator [Mucilaginibacter sp. 21P]|uniref:response regulator transcription factor n=1 Tax=Mucilaginibacter sp. 21P TaxID=2778902 RepID=UPI001C55BCB0|nr:response regulator [Mucilaginibacter sp. 21P]QXV66771.1 response regulator [Mucilaginibacter sp. 21P]
MHNRKKKVLVIDDDHDILEIISIVLDSEGCEVLTTDNGKDVEQLVRSFSPDIILLDVMLGDMDGRDICKALKSADDTANTPIIIVSATHGWHTRHEKYCNADHYISKPFDVTDLVEQVFKLA